MTDVAIWSRNTLMALHAFLCTLPGLAGPILDRCRRDHAERYKYGRKANATRFTVAAVNLLDNRLYRPCSPCRWTEFFQPVLPIALSLTTDFLPGVYLALMVGF